MVATVAAGGVAGLAGCAGVGGGTGDGDGGGSVLSSVRVLNEAATAHEVHVLVERGGEVVHWSSHELGAGGTGTASRRLAGGWGDSPGQFTLHVRLDGADDWETFRVGRRETACYGVEARISADGEVSLWFRQDAPGCEDGATTTDASG